MYFITKAHLFLNCVRKISKAAFLLQGFKLARYRATFMGEPVDKRPIPLPEGI